MDSLSLASPLLFCLRPYDLTLQVPFTLSSALTFYFLKTLSRKYGLRRSLFLDQLRQDSRKVMADYIKLFRKTLLTLLLCCLQHVIILDALYKVPKTWSMHPSLRHSIASALRGEEDQNNVLAIPTLLLCVDLLACFTGIFSHRSGMWSTNFLGIFYMFYQKMKVNIDTMLCLCIRKNEEASISVGTMFSFIS